MEVKHIKEIRNMKTQKTKSKNLFLFLKSQILQIPGAGITSLILFIFPLKILAVKTKKGKFQQP